MDKEIVISRLEYVEIRIETAIKSLEIERKAIEEIRKEIGKW